MRLLRVIPMMQQTRILLFPPARGTQAAQSPQEVKTRLGAEVVAVEERTFDEMISAADDQEVRAEAERWRKEAKEAGGELPWAHPLDLQLLPALGAGAQPQVVRIEAREDHPVGVQPVFRRSVR